MNVRVASWVAERLKTLREKLRSIGKIPEVLGIDGEYSAGQPSGKFWQLYHKNPKDQL